MFKFEIPTSKYRLHNRIVNTKGNFFTYDLDIFRPNKKQLFKI